MSILILIYLLWLSIFLTLKLVIRWISSKTLVSTFILTNVVKSATLNVSTIKTDIFWSEVVLRSTKKVSNFFLLCHPHKREYKTRPPVKQQLCKTRRNVLKHKPPWNCLLHHGPLPICFEQHPITSLPDLQLVFIFALSSFQVFLTKELSLVDNFCHFLPGPIEQGADAENKRMLTPKNSNRNMLI